MSAVGHPTEHATVPEVQGTWDWWLLGVTALLAGLGLLMILSASSAQADAQYGDATRFVTRQGIGLLLGAAAALLVLRLPWLWLRQACWPVYTGAAISLLLVLTPLGHASNGAVRWVRVGGVNFSPPSSRRSGW